MTFIKVSPRHLSLFVLTGCFLILLLSTGNQVFPHYSFVDYTTCGFVNDRMSECDLRCPVDPFTKPGMLYLGSEVSDTRWIPFPHNSRDISGLHSSQVHDRETPPEAFEDACPQYMKQVSRNETGIDWVRNKTVLFIGSSHDRNNIRNFCQEVHGKFSTIGDHTAGFCRLEAYNFVLAFWFMYGAIDADDYEWFSPPEARPLTFENRTKEIMLPWMAERGLNSPNLVIETSLFWDDGFLKQLAVHSHRRGHEAFTYSELSWHRSRVRSLVLYTRALFGNNIPIMLRTRHLRESNKWNRLLRIFQLDQNLRHVSKELGVKLFKWGDLLEGYTDFYDGDQHFNHGAVTWLFGDMTLFYLKQAVTGNCWSCEGI